MKVYFSLLKIDLKLALRDKAVIFFNYLFPLIFFFAFAEMMHANQGGTVSYVVTMVLVLGILGNGLWGAGMRTVQDREMNILRRFKVTPIGPAPLLIASTLTGWIIYLPAVLLVLTLAHFFYGMPVPERWLSLFLMVTLGLFAFRSIGLIIASIANSMQETTIAVQLLYMPMLFLSGATFPTTSLPRWAQMFAQFLPASYLVTGFQGIFFRRETLIENWPAVIALLVTLLVGTFLAAQLFRWEKGEKMRPAAKFWLLAVLGPFVLLGGWQAYSKEHIAKAETLWRDLQRSETFLIRGARIFVGDGRVIESGGVLVKGGKVDQVFAATIPDASSLKAEVVEGTGKTLLPGLIDVDVHLSAPGGIPESMANYDARAAMRRALAAYLYSGITAVRSAGDPLDSSLELRAEVASGKRLGAELFVCGPLFTAEGGHGTEYAQYLAQSVRRAPKTAEEARQAVRILKRAGVDGIRVILEAGWPGMLFNRLDTALARAVAEESRAQNLPLAVHTGDARDVADALEMRADSIEHGPTREKIPEQLLLRLARDRVAYDPTLSVLEAFAQLASGHSELLNRSLVQQVAPPGLISATRKRLEQPGTRSGPPAEVMRRALEQSRENLMAAYRAGATLVTGSDAGNPLVIHGPTVHHEMQLWVQAGIPAYTALRAATLNAARLLRVDDRIGMIAPGREANLLLVDGNPLEDINATERISLVIFKGERIRRSGLLE